VVGLVINSLALQVTNHLFVGIDDEDAVVVVPCLSVYLSVTTYVSVCLSVCLFVCLSICLCACLRVYLFRLPLRLFVDPYIHRLLFCVSVCVVCV
jgi:hypothetical protein